jgi:UDP-N-acetylmuramate dehydrogenase
MITIHTNYPIGDLFTWRVQTTAKYFAEVRSLDDLRTVCSSDEFKSSAQHYVLGRGANTLFATRHYDGFVIQMGILGLTQVHEDADSITFRIGAGQDWHSTIEALIQHYGVGGMENLAYIPGTFGAAPIQNVGAYGQTFEDVFVELEAYETKKFVIEKYGKDVAKFEYRGSYFKSREFLDTHIIISVTVRLEKQHIHALNTSYHSNYESLKSELQGNGPFTPIEIFEAVTHLRKKKLPEISTVGTNGSTFINPLVTGAKLKELLLSYPKLQYYPAQPLYGKRRL